MRYDPTAPFVPNPDAVVCTNPECPSVMKRVGSRIPSCDCKGAVQVLSVTQHETYSKCTSCGRQFISGEVQK